MQPDLQQQPPGPTGPRRALHWAVSTLLMGTLALASGPARASDKLAAKAGCALCHATGKPLVGPSYHDIALRYKGKANAPALLRNQVRQGSRGVWGKVPMPPTDTAKLSDADLDALISWLLKTP